MCPLGVSEPQGLFFLSIDFQNGRECIFAYTGPCAFEVWEWISDPISHFTGYVMTYPCCDQS